MITSGNLGTIKYYFDRHNFAIDNNDLLYFAIKINNVNIFNWIFKTFNCKINEENLLEIINSHNVELIENIIINKFIDVDLFIKHSTYDLDTLIQNNEINLLDLILKYDAIVNINSYIKCVSNIDIIQISKGINYILIAYVNDINMLEYLVNNKYFKFNISFKRILEDNISSGNLKIVDYILTNYPNKYKNIFQKDISCPQFMRNYLLNID